MLDFKYEKIPRQDICPAKNCQNGGSFFKSHVMIMMGKKPIPYFHEYQAIDIHNHRRNLMAPYNQVPFTVEMQVVFFNSNLNNAVYCEKSAISNIFDKHLLIPKQNEIVSLCDLVIKYGCAIGYIIPDFYKRYLDEYKKNPDEDVFCDGQIELLFCNRVRKEARDFIFEIMKRGFTRMGID